MEENLSLFTELPTGKGWISTEMSALRGGSDLGDMQRRTVAIAAERIREMEQCV
jgi:hypothetical protein